MSLPAIILHKTDFYHVSLAELYALLINIFKKPQRYLRLVSFFNYKLLLPPYFPSNCLTYQYWYQPKFYNWLPVFPEKAQTTGTNQSFIIHCSCFSCCYLFVSLWHCSHMSLSYLSSDDGLIFLFFVLWGLGLLLCLKSKKHKGSDSLPSLMGNYHKSYLHAYLCQNFWVNG